MPDKPIVLSRNELSSTLQTARQAMAVLEADLNPNVQARPQEVAAARQWLASPDNMAALGVALRQFNARKPADLTNALNATVPLLTRAGMAENAAMLSEVANAGAPRTQEQQQKVTELTSGTTTDTVALFDQFAKAMNGDADALMGPAEARARMRAVVNYLHNNSFKDFNGADPAKTLAVTTGQSLLTMAAAPMPDKAAITAAVTTFKTDIANQIKARGPGAPMPVLPGVPDAMRAAKIGALTTGTTESTRLLFEEFGKSISGAPDALMTPAEARAQLQAVITKVERNGLVGVVGADPAATLVVTSGKKLLALTAGAMPDKAKVEAELDNFRTELPLQINGRAPQPGAPGGVRIPPPAVPRR